MSTLLQQAIAAHQTSQFGEAEKMYRAVLVEQPQQADAMALLGVVLAAKNNTDEAIGLIEQAIQLDPQSALFKFHLGSVLMHAKQLPQAIVAFRQAIELQPQLAQAHFNLANALRASDDWQQAIEVYRKALQCQPNHPEARNNLALTLVHEKDFTAAVLEAKKTVEVAPNYADGWLTLCNIAEQVKDYHLALHAGEQSIKMLPNDHRSWFGYGVALNRLDRHEEAIAAYQHALVLKPDRADLWDNLGQTYQSLNRLEEAEATYRKTVEVAGQSIADEDKRQVDESEYGTRHWHLALMELLRGKYPHGFARYRSRFKEVGGLTRPTLSRPLWKGEDLSCKTILITDEQGFGDTLMLARFLPLLHKRGAKIIFSVHPVLRPLFESWPHADTIIVHGDTVPAYDYYASVFDLPHLLKITLDNLPNATPYLPVLEADEATRLTCPKPKVGVVWGGNPLHSNDAKRSIPLTIFAGLFALGSMQFYSLNRDLKDGDEDILVQHPVENLAPRLKTFADGARFINQMDLIITVDTATSHLAGGMGKQVWTLLPFAPDWRWLTERDDSPWYPGMRLFRQKEIGDWSGVIQNVKVMLQQKFY